MILYLQKLSKIYDSTHKKCSNIFLHKINLLNHLHDFYINRYHTQTLNLKPPTQLKTIIKIILKITQLNYSTKLKNEFKKEQGLLSLENSCSKLGKREATIHRDEIRRF